jgi:hypothetical protein
MLLRALLVAAVHARLPSQRSPSRYADRLASSAAGTFDTAYAYNTSFYPSFADQLNFYGRDSAATFPQRYLLNLESWGGPTHPIFVYTGNEGDIRLFTNNTGFLWSLPAEMKAAVCFCEPGFSGEQCLGGSPVPAYQGVFLASSDTANGGRPAHSAAPAAGARLRLALLAAAAALAACL